MVTLNAETDVIIGAVLGRMARSAGVVYTGSAGDEPGGSWTSTTSPAPLVSR